MRRIHVFANPIAGRGRGRVIAERIVALLSRAGDYSPRLFLQRADQVSPDEFCADGQPDALIAIGGDGTLRGVASRMLEVCPPDKPLPPLLIIPMGTANLMGKHLGISWAANRIEHQVLDAIRAHRIVHLDAARANGRLFLLMAGVGLDAQIVHELDRMRSGPINLASYVLPSLKAVGFLKFPILTVTVDNKRVFGPAAGLAFVGNVKEYGTGFPILPLARSDDRLLDVCALPVGTYEQLARTALLAITSDHIHMEGAVYVKGSSVRIESDQQTPVQIDGEAAGYTPLEITLLDRRIPFVVPRNSL